jgi:hypothetical protein
MRLSLIGCKRVIKFSETLLLETNIWGGGVFLVFFGVLRGCLCVIQGCGHGGQVAQLVVQCLSMYWLCWPMFG